MLCLCLAAWVKTITCFLWMVFRPLCQLEEPVMCLNTVKNGTSLSRPLPNDGHHRSSFTRYILFPGNAVCRGSMFSCGHLHGWTNLSVCRHLCVGENVCKQCDGRCRWEAAKQLIVLPLWLKPRADRWHLCDQGAVAGLWWQKQAALGPLWAVT